ncbi:MAG: ribonuclease H-like domain-containing protein [Rhodothermaceae bacterium]|nr:ribonuclease H-like domain-containing protein [Rhodothermaceae bacterium]
MALPTDFTLFGKSSREHIVAVHAVGGIKSSEPAQVRVYSRTTPNGPVEITTEHVYPFFFLADIKLLASFSRSRYQFQQLNGSNHFKYLVVFTTWKDYWDALNHVERAAPKEASKEEVRYRISSPVQQYLMQTGNTLFKGMTFEEIHRMQLDIEVYTEGGFPNPSRETDQVIIIALSDNRGWNQLIHIKGRTEREALEELVTVIRDKDPDVIEGHNIFAFDFMYLRARYKRYRIPFAIGRDGSEPRTFPSSMRFAERTIDFPAIDIAGRHVIDTYFQVMSYDVFKRNLPGYGLKTVAKYFGLTPEDRTYIDGDEISPMWRSDPDAVLRYALDDVIETERLASMLSGSTFYLTQMVPGPYGQLARTGPASKIEALFIREYLREKESIPKSEWGSQTMGGYTDVFFTGVTGPIVYADVESLYPSIMLNYDIRPKHDSLKLFPALLQQLTSLRLDAKKRMNEATNEQERSELDALQSSYKILINSFYGSLGFSHATFNDFSEADRVASIGQEILRQIIHLLNRERAQVIEVDTDGVLFVPPEAYQGEEAERTFIHMLNQEMPKGIRIGFDGRFQKMLSYKKKNYALLSYDGSLKFKGSSLVSRSSEKFGRAFVREAIELLLEEDFDGLHTLYLSTRDKIIAHEWTPNAFSRTETLKDTLVHYQADVRAGKRQRAASYELAQRRLKETGQNSRKGDRISYYITGHDSNAASYERADFIENWSKDQPNENTAYYLRRLDEFAQKLEPFFKHHDFRLIFSPEDLFGFDSSGIVLRSSSKAQIVDVNELPI